MGPTRIPETEPARAGRSRRKLAFAGAIAGIALALLFVAGYVPRHIRNSEVAAAAARNANAAPVVSAVQVKRAAEVSDLLLPGTLTPLTEAYVYARATGYVRRRYADIGDRVRAGQVLAEIEAPDLDEQVRQAQASVARSEKSLGQAQGALRQAEAQLELARVTWNRYEGLANQGVIAGQEADQALASFRAGTATVQALNSNAAAAEESIRVNRASLQRLLALQQFEQVRAPFAGVVTARNIDIGAFISGGGSQQGLSTTPMGGTQNAGAIGTAGAATANDSSAIAAAGAPGGSALGPGGEMFRMAQIDAFRVLIDVPEENAPSMHPGETAEVFLQAFPGRSFPGRVTRTANALNGNTHTLLTEVQMRNPSGELMPGMFAEVRISSRRRNRPVLVPGSSLIIRADGPKVAVLEEAHQQEKALRRVRLQSVIIGRDYGTETEITQGLRGSEYIVATPGDRVQEGAIVKPEAAPPSRSRAGNLAGSQTQSHPGGITPNSQAEQGKASASPAKSGGKE